MFKGTHLPVHGDTNVFGELDVIVVILVGLGTSYGGGSCARDPVEWSNP